MNTLDFIASQVAIWGDEYVDNLIDNKYFPMLTSAGWRWVYVSDSDYPAYVESALDTAAPV